MKRNFLIIGLFILAVLFNSQMDKINFTHSGWFTGWWIELNWAQPFWQKYLLPMTVDGWHLIKFLFLSTIMCYVIIKEKLKWYWWFILMVIWGLLFNLFYHI